MVEVCCSAEGSLSPPVPKSTIGSIGEPGEPAMGGNGSLDLGPQNSRKSSGASATGLSPVVWAFLLHRSDSIHSPLLLRYRQASAEGASSLGGEGQLGVLSAETGFAAGVRVTGQDEARVAAGAYGDSRAALSSTGGGELLFSHSWTLMRMLFRTIEEKEGGELRSHWQLYCCCGPN